MSDAAATLKQSNDQRKVEALTKKIRKAHNWRVQVWAQNMRRIEAMTAELGVLGAAPVDLFEPDFTDPAQVEHYATMSLD